MILQPLPDLAASLRLQDQSRGVRAALDAAGQELTTGITSDISRHTGGRLAPVFAIDRALERLGQTRQDLAMAAGRAESAQTALAQVEAASGDLAIGLLGALDRGDPVSGAGYLGQANTAMEQVVDALNTRFAGSSLFSGAAADATALAGVDAIMADVEALVGAAADPAAAIAAVDTYFDTPGGGFETAIYGGSTTDAAGAPVAEGARITYLPRADASELRALLKPLAMIAAADNGAFAGDPVQKSDFLAQSARMLLGARDGIVDLRSALGTAEERIDTARDATEAETSALSISRNDLVGVDQYDAAARFADLEGQLQALYTVTARLSGLKLTNFLR